MTKKEKELFKQLVTPLKTKVDSTLIKYASAEVLGNIFYNRMQGVAFTNLKNSGLLSSVNREFRNSLKAGFDVNCRKNECFFTCLNELYGILKKYKIKASMLKGARLCSDYPKGCRTSSDIDLLIESKDVTALGKVLKKEGFSQGKIVNGSFVPATRKDIIESKFLRGETVPYIKRTGNDFFEFFEIDLNFSLDYKNGDNKLIKKLIKSSVTKESGGAKIITLNDTDFFLHLCAHLFKEATVLPWVKMKRDMTLYKYADIYLLLLKATDSEIFKIFKKAKDSGLEKECAFAILQTAQLFGNKFGYAVLKAKEIYLENPDLLDTVISPSDKKSYIFKEKDILKRFFLKNREKNLKEQIYEKT